MKIYGGTTAQKRRLIVKFIEGGVIFFAMFFGVLAVCGFCSIIFHLLGVE